IMVSPLNSGPGQHDSRRVIGKKACGLQEDCRRSTGSSCNPLASRTCQCRMDGSNPPEAGGLSRAKDSAPGLLVAIGHLNGERRAGQDEAVVAHEKGVPAGGGYVLLSAGTVKRMTPAEFSAAPKAVKK